MQSAAYSCARGYPLVARTARGGPVPAISGGIREQAVAQCQGIGGIFRGDAARAVAKWRGDIACITGQWQAVRHCGHGAPSQRGRVGRGAMVRDADTGVRVCRVDCDGHHPRRLRAAPRVRGRQQVSAEGDVPGLCGARSSSTRIAGDSELAGLHQDVAPVNEGHFDGECRRCGCPREWRTWGPCACGQCDSQPCVSLRIRRRPGIGEISAVGVARPHETAEGAG